MWRRCVLKNTANSALCPFKVCLSSIPADETRLHWRTAHRKGYRRWLFCGLVLCRSTPGGRGRRDMCCRLSWLRSQVVNQRAQQVLVAVVICTATHCLGTGRSLEQACSEGPGRKCSPSREECSDSGQEEFVAQSWPPSFPIHHWIFLRQYIQKHLEAIGTLLAYNSAVMLLNLNLQLQWLMKKHSKKDISGQFIINPYPEIFGQFGARIPLLFTTTIWGDYSAGLVVNDVFDHGYTEIGNGKIRIIIIKMITIPASPKVQ